MSKGKAFLGLFLKAERRIFAYIFTLLPNRTDAEDVLQEVSKLMWEKFDEADPPGDFVALGLPDRLLQGDGAPADQRRDRVIFSDAMLERVAETVSEHADALQLDERHEALACCLGKLSRGDRQLLDERFKDGATVRSVAERLGRSADAVYKALARVRRALHDCVERTIAAEGPRMTLEPERLDELRRLLEALCEERITPEEGRGWRRWCWPTREAEALYITYLTMQADLSREIGGHPAPAGAGDDARPECTPGPGAGRRPRRWSWVPWTLAVGACLLAATMSGLVAWRGAGGGRSGEPRSWPAASAPGEPVPAAAGSSSTIATPWPW